MYDKNRENKLTSKCETIERHHVPKKQVEPTYTWNMFSERQQHVCAEN